MGSWVLDLIPPLPPQWAPGAQHVHCQCVPWSPGPSNFRSFFRFDFGLDFGLVLGPFWARLGRLLGPFWEPKSGQVGSKMRLEPSFVRKWRCSKNIGNRRSAWKSTFSKKWPLKTHFWPNLTRFGLPKGVQKRPKTSPKWIQNESKIELKIGAKQVILRNTSPHLILYTKLS